MQIADYYLPGTINNQMQPNTEPNQQGSLTGTDFQQLLLQKMEMAQLLTNGLLNQEQINPMMAFSSSPYQNMMDFNLFSSPNASQMASFMPGQMSQVNTFSNPIVNDMQQERAAYDAYKNPNITANKTNKPAININAPTTEYNDLIRQAAKKHGVDEKLIHAVIKMESNYNPKVTSHAGAVGLMQLMPITAKYVGVTNRWDNAQNIDGGTKYLSEMLRNNNGNLTLALASYNAGPGNVKKYGGVPPFKETQNYIKKVTDYYQKL